MDWFLLWHFPNDIIITTIIIVIITVTICVLSSGVLEHQLLNKYYGFRYQFYNEGAYLVSYSLYKVLHKLVVLFIFSWATESGQTVNYDIRSVFPQFCDVGFQK